MQTSTSGGSSDSEAKELTVRPAGWLDSVFAVTTVTPLAKRLMALRNSSLLTGIAPLGQLLVAGCQLPVRTCHQLTTGNWRLATAFYTWRSGRRGRWSSRCDGTCNSPQA